jgi:hypothetical protein
MKSEQTKAAMTPAKKTWLTNRVQELHRDFAARQKQSTSTHSSSDRVDVITQVYRELWALGYRMEKVESLAPRHLAALLSNWKTRGLSRETARIRWGHLGRWCVVIGKAGMAPAFLQVWPKDDAEVISEQSAASAAGSKRRGSHTNRTIEGLSDERYVRLLDLLGKRDDQTGYWLVRCVRELGLNREESVLFEPLTGRGLHGTRVLVSSSKGRQSRFVQLDTPSKMTLVDECCVFMRERGRKRLGWRDHTIAQMLKRYANLVGYAMRLLDNEQGSQGSSAVTDVRADAVASEQEGVQP